MKECWWIYILGQDLGSAEKIKKKQGEGVGLKVICEEDIPENIVNLLGKGPKCGVEPSVPADELYS